MSWRDTSTAGSMGPHTYTPSSPYYPSRIEDRWIWTQDMLAAIPDDVLLAECRRRGLEARR